MRLRRRAWLAGTAATAATGKAGAGGAGEGGAAAAALPDADTAVSIEPAPPSVRQGRTLLVRIVVDAPPDGPAVTAWLARPDTPESTPLRVFDAPGADGAAHFLAIAGIPVDAPVGGWVVAATARDGAGRAVAEAAAPLEVADGGFPAQRLGFAGELLSLLAPEVGEEERLTMAAVFAASTATEPYWRGRLRQPVAGRLVTSHGARRDYLDPAGNVLARSQHGGIDLAAPAGTPIAAPAAGVVAFAGRWSIRGNVVVVDHGAGVHTVHAHASALLVAPGQEVSQGQPLALVGSTGLSTGPHLHWEVRAGGVGVDPLEWTQREDLGLG